MERLLVTGGCGYVGSHMVRHALASGMPAGKIVIFDNLERGHLEFVARDVELVRGDLRNPADVAALFQRHRFDSIAHFAAYGYVGESMRAPELYFRNNVVGGINLLEAARQAGVRNFLFSSSCTVYGTPRALPITEDFPAAPDNAYGETKRCFEDCLRWYAQIHGLRSVCLRYFNAAGAGYGIGEWHAPETHLIPLVLQAALGSIPKLTIHGDDYDTPDGTCIRDYVHVIDLAEAHLRALDAMERDAVRHARINLGTGRGTSVREVMRIAAEISGRDVPHQIGPRRPGDPAALYADPALAEDLLGWVAQRDIRGIVGDAWRWHSRASAVG